MIANLMCPLFHDFVLSAMTFYLNALFFYLYYLFIITIILL